MEKIIYIRYKSYLKALIENNKKLKDELYIINAKIIYYVLDVGEYLI